MMVLTLSTPFDEPSLESTPRSVPIATSPSFLRPSSPSSSHYTFWSPIDTYSSEEDSDELDIRNVSAFDEWDGDITTAAAASGDDRGYHSNQRNIDDLRGVLSFDEVVYSDDDCSDNQYQDDLMWSVSLSNRCHKSLRDLFLPSASSKEEESLTHTQVTKVISNKKRAAVLPNIRELKHSPASETITGATVDCSMYTKTSDKTNDSNSSSSSWNSLWCCGVSPSYAEDSLGPIQRRLFASSKPAPPIPDFVIMKQAIRASSEHLLRQLENDEDSTSSITVFEDDDSFWSI
ncbi:MAG: hypothetical protein SGBAC_004546 [Bacillariaceae sp.]